MAAKTLNVLLSVFALACMLSFGECQGTAEAPLKEEAKCHPIRDSICTALNYNWTTLPNFVGHRSPQMANFVINQSIALIQTGCSNAIVHLLCSIHLPFCSTLHDRLIRLRPCKSLCKEVREKCEPTFKELHQTPPPYLDCECSDTDGEPLYREWSQDNPLCFGPLDPSELKMPNIPGITVRTIDRESSGEYQCPWYIGDLTLVPHIPI